MSAPSPPPPEHPKDTLANELARARTHLGNERTHLAYLRTTVSLIGFGITINRFSMFLSQNDEAPTASRMLLRDAGNAGIGMVVLGMALLLWSLLRYRSVGREIEAGRVDPRHRATTLFSIGLLLLGGWTALWLFLK